MKHNRRYTTPIIIKTNPHRPPTLSLILLIVGTEGVSGEIGVPVSSTDSLCELEVPESDDSKSDSISTASFA